MSTKKTAKRCQFGAFLPKRPIIALIRARVVESKRSDAPQSVIALRSGDAGRLTAGAIRRAGSRATVFRVEHA